MKYELSTCILISTLAGYTVQLNQRLKCIHSDCVSPQLLVSVFITVPTNTENSNFFLTLVCVLFLVVQLRVHMLFLLG